MNQSEQEIQVVEVSWSDRWQVYNRLQELEILCWCGTNQPLRVQVNTLTALVQVQSVLRQLTASRQDLVRWLEHSWRLS